jgi:hypothetical protein
MALQFKFVELSTVTDETLEVCVNEWVGQGWMLEGIRFVLTEHSKRPAMAFVSFTRDVTAQVADHEPPRRPPPLVRPSGDAPSVITAANRDDVE